MVRLPDSPRPGRTPGPAIEPQRDGSIPIRQFPGGPVLASVSSRGETLRDPLILPDNHRHLCAGHGEFVERIWDLQVGSGSASETTDLRTTFLGVE